MRLLAAASALAACLAAVAAQAEERAELPAAVEANVAEIAGMCREAEGDPNTADVVKRVDLTGDGHEDFVLFTGWAYCGGFASLYGDREKAVAVYAGDGAGGAAEAFSDAVFDVELEEAGTAASLWLTISGAGCGKPPAPDFAHENFCERSLVWNAASRKFQYAPVSTVRMIE